MFKYTLDNKRYYTINYFYKTKFGCKVAKIPLDANIPCPNKKIGGCIYCSNGSASNIINSSLDIQKQFQDEIKIYERKWPKCKYIAYFQSGTNTNTSVSNLKKLIDPMLNIQNLVGISIATRPDSISNECLEYLSELNNKTFLTIELGLQSSNNETLNFIRRGHSKEDFTNCVNKLHSKNIFVVVHIINGLPYETKENMLDTIKYLNEININGLKIHMLSILKNTDLEKYYLQNKFKILTKEEYIDIVTEQLKILKPKIVIERITGDPIKEELIEPKWLINKRQLINDIDKTMVLKDIYQGMCYNNNGDNNE
jgi:radical SAM protein (TIGR01212 family)